MAQGKKCSCCGHYMFADREDEQPQGTWVTYICRNGQCARCNGKCTMTEKVFEAKR